MHRPGVGQAHDRRRVKAHADREAFRQRLMRCFGGQIGRGWVVRADARGISAGFHEIGLKLRWIDAAQFGMIRILRR
jgi:hypothetical protein